MDTAIFEKYGLKPLEPLLETGPMSIWKMTQPEIHRTVLVHVLGKELTDDPTVVDYLFSVVRMISNAHAPAIAQVYTIFNEPDFKGVVSEFVDGLTLSQTVAALGPLSIKQTIRTGIAVAEALKDVWDSFHIIYGAARPEFVTLDASSTAKIISPCFAQIAQENVEVPVADMADLGELMYFLATGVKPGHAHNVNLPKDFSDLLEKLSSKNPLTCFASWDSAIEALRALEDQKPAAAAPAPAPAEKSGGGKKLSVKRSFGAPTGKVPKAVKHDGPARSVSIAPRLAIEPPSKASSAMQAVRKAARERAMAEDRRSSGSGAKLFAGIMLVVVLAGVFVMRIGLAEFDIRMANRGQAGQSPEETQARPISVVDTPAAQDPVPSAAPAASAANAATAQSSKEDDDIDSLMSQLDDNDSSALNRYLAAHVGQEVPFVHKGVTHKVTLVSYTEDSVTIRTRKILTLKRSELSPEQLALWK